ncbi:MAG: hypothetical protein JST20_14360 [Bacteroidetes bacterium]|nr:hypothetical protein [Bacteroidota bacterium]
MNIKELTLKLEEAKKAEKTGNYSESERFANEVAIATESEKSSYKELRAEALLILAVDAERRKDFNLALDYRLKLLSIFEEIENQKAIVEQLSNIASIYANESWNSFKYAKAEEYYLKALVLCTELRLKKKESILHERLADIYMLQKKWGKFASHFRRYDQIKDEIQEEEAKAQELRFERETARARLEATESLLHKMLPQSIVVRMMNGETDIADHYENISILFADIVGFTPIATEMSASALLTFMNMLFEQYDTFALKYNCERIKTIGDGYLAVCGAPESNQNHVQNIALMALDMLEYSLGILDIQKIMPPGIDFQIRIGLHCGPVIAGVIGTGKICYDIYGDTVNIAARMESHSEPGKIHVSEEFRTALISTKLNELSMQLIPRGEVDIKGKGVMKTYFLERAQ